MDMKLVWEIVKSGVIGMAAVFSFIASQQAALPGWRLAGFVVPSAWAQAGGLRDYSVDIFYCEGGSADVTNARRARAQKALERIKQSNTGVSARVRFLPTLVQARPGYQSSKDEIRFVEQGTERAAAAELAKIVGVTPVAVRPVEQRTLYLSAFYCAG